MGVHGLTGYVNKNPSLGTTVVLTQADPTAEKIPFIIDGLSWTYHIGLIDPLRGGNYTQLARTARLHIEYWRNCGLEPEFVWDGPFDVSKLPTVISRSTQSLQRTVTYMKSGDGARQQPAMRKAASRLPPFTHQTISSVLEELNVVSHCADGEGDSPTAELAQAKNGFVLSNDSDYFIYNSVCRGYVPLQTIAYGSTNDVQLDRLSDPSDIRMQFQVYRHETIARSLSLPPSFLPIFAALLGNDLVDFASEICLPRKHFYPGRVEPQEINRIARALSRSAILPARTVVELERVIFSVLPLLLSRPASDVEIITKLAASAYAYRLLPIALPSPSFPLNPCSIDSPSRAIARDLYYRAYKSSHLSSFVVHILKHRTVVLQGSLEKPEFPSPVVQIGRPIRQIIYSIMDHTLGIDSPVKAIMEYCRRQEHLNPTSVPILPLETYLPRDFTLQPETNLVVHYPRSIRFHIYLNFLRLPPNLLPSPSLPIVASLSHLVLHCSTKRRWTNQELLAATLTATVLLYSPAPTTNRSSVRPFPTVSMILNLPKPREPPRKDNLQLSAEWLASLVWTNTLLQAFLLGRGQPQHCLSPSPADTVDWMEIEEGLETAVAPWKCYDGNLFHSLLELPQDRFDKFFASQNEVVKKETNAVMNLLEEMSQLVE